MTARVEMPDTYVWASEGDNCMHVECLPAVETLAMPREFHTVDPELERCTACGGYLAWHRDDIRNNEYRKW